MKIETKFSINDTVWVMKDNKPHSICIYGIRANVSAYYGHENETSIVLLHNVLM